MLFLLINWNFQTDGLGLKTLEERLNAVVGRQAEQPSQAVRQEDGMSLSKGAGGWGSRREGCVALSRGHGPMAAGNGLRTVKQGRQGSSDGRAQAGCSGSPGSQSKGACRRVQVVTRDELALPIAPLGASLMRWGTRACEGMAAVFLGGRGHTGPFILGVFLSPAGGGLGRSQGRAL